MAVMSGVIESTVDGFFVHNPLISDKHLTHYLTFFSRTARMALRRSKDKMQDVDNFQGLEAYIDAGDGMVGLDLLPHFEECSSLIATGLYRYNSP